MCLARYIADLIANPNVLMGRRYLANYRFLPLKEFHSLHLQGTFLFDSPVNETFRNFPFKITATSKMIVKAISNADCALIGRICFDQWHIQKCHNRLRALEVLSQAPDEAVFRRFTTEMVSAVVEVPFWFLFIYISSDICCNFPDVRGRLAKSWIWPISSWACTKRPLPQLPHPIFFSRRSLMRLPFYPKWWQKNSIAGRGSIVGTAQWWTTRYLDVLRSRLRSRIRVSNLLLGER